MAITNIPGVRPLLSAYSGLMDILRPKSIEGEGEITPAMIREALRGGAFNLDGSPTGALKITTVAACEAAIADTVGQLPMAVYRRKGEGKVKDPKHPLHALLHDRPNEFQTPFTFWRLIVQLCIRRGNAFVFIERNGVGDPIALLPLENDKVEVKFGPSKYFLYAKKHQLAPSDVLHFMGKSCNGIVGKPLLEGHDAAVMLAAAAEAYGVRFFIQGSAHGPVLEFPGPLSDVQFKQVKESWESAHSGPDNQHKAAILPHGGKVSSAGTNNRDMEFGDLRRFQRIEICGLFNVPPSRIGIYESGGLTYNNPENANRDFLVHSIKPWTDRISQEINTKLLSGAAGDVFAEHNFADLLMADTTTRYAAYEKGFGKWLTVNDIRRAENLPDIEGGDTLPTTPITPKDAGQNTTNAFPQGEAYETRN